MPLSIKNNQPLPVDVVFAPEWWHRHGGITFDQDFYFHPARRVEEEQRMEKILYDRWGEYGMGEHRETGRPEVGPVHLAAGYLISEMLGCQVQYFEDHPPRVLEAKQDALQVEEQAAFHSNAYQRFEKLLEALKKKHGRLQGDVNWGGVLNVALDLRGDGLFTDMMMDPEGIQKGLQTISRVIAKFVSRVEHETGTSSISVNRNVRHLSPAVFLHSECSHTMISTDLYEQFLLPLDIAWSQQNAAFGIHYCGEDPHRYAQSFAKILKLDFLDVGWGGDVEILRRHLPNTFLNIRLDPRTIGQESPDGINRIIRKLVQQSSDPNLTGVCCINMDDQVPDANVTAIFETVKELRRELGKQN